MKPELLAPVSDYGTLKAAVSYGADAVYFGLGRYNLRVKAKGFKELDLPKIVNYCRSNRVKCYLTINSVIFEDELSSVERLVKLAKTAGIDAIIVSDLAVISLAILYKIPFHISTQLNVTNSAAANFYKELGASRVILSRECSLKQVREIIKHSKIPIEVFVHGALCVSVSGRCFFSKLLHDKSANRGECSQPCRREWTVTNSDGELVYDGERFLNSRDLCMIEHIPELLKLGAVSFKIEGRMRDANYVKEVVSCYREAIDSFSKSKVPLWLSRLSSVFNRGFCTGFYYARPDNESELFIRGNVSSVKRREIGVVSNYYSKASAASINLCHSSLKIGDVVYFSGTTTSFSQRIDSIMIEGKSVNSAAKGSLVSVKVLSKTRKNDAVFCIE